MHKFYLLIFMNPYSFIRYGHLSHGWRCRVYRNLDRVEALRVSSLFRSAQPVEDKLTLQEEVDICRAILYEDNLLEPEDEPVRMTASTRKKCALALGKSATYNVSLTDNNRNVVSHVIFRIVFRA